MDVYVERKRTGFLNNLGGSIMGVLIGILFFLGSFPLLWWNEGRADLSRLAAKSTPTQSDPVDPAREGQFVSVTGNLQADVPLEDPLYLNPGDYITLAREVEVFAWVEETTTKEEKNLGGSTDTTTTYVYKKEWTSTPEATSSFKVKEGHENPIPPVKSQVLLSSRTRVGAYQFDATTTDLPTGSALPLTPELVKPGFRLENGEIYVGLGSLSAPQLGDMRISYRALTGGREVTLFGMATGDSITKYVTPEGDSLLRVLEGTRDQAIAELAAEHKLITWVLRGVGFLLMWIGLGLFFGPVNAILDIVPFLGKAGRAVVGFATFPVALVLSVVTILLSMIFHNIYLLIGTVVLLVLLFILLASRKKASS